MLNILFLCTGNSVRSILAEAIANRDGAGRLHAFSAGSNPTGRVHPAVTALLKRQAMPTHPYRSKSWHEFTAPGAPRLDMVVTVCAGAAGETCPIWPGAPVTAHWAIQDPASVPADQVDMAIRAASHRLSQRINAMLALPLETIDRGALTDQLQEISERG